MHSSGCTSKERWNQPLRIIMTTDNQKFKEEFKEKYGVYPVTEEDIPEEEL